MVNEQNHSSGSTIVDLSGLPVAVVQSIKQLVDSLRNQESHADQEPRPSLRGRFAELKLSISQEDIDAARKEAWAGFPSEFQEPSKS